MNRDAVRCSCGSGARYRRCHGGGGEGALERLSALAYAHDLPAHFPSLRPRGELVHLLAERTARELGENDGYVPPAAFEPALELLGPRERRRLVELEEAEMPGNWERVAEAADEEVLMRCLAAGSFAALVADLRPPLRVHLAQFEDFDDLTRSPSLLLSGVLPASAVWSVHEAERAVSAAEGLGGRAWMRAVQEVGYDVLESDHLLRVARLVSVLAAHLPVPSLPRMSARLRVATRRVEREDEEAEETTVLLLVAYAAAMDRGAVAASLN